MNPFYLVILKIADGTTSPVCHGTGTRPKRFWGEPMKMTRAMARSEGLFHMNANCIVKVTLK